MAIRNLAKARLAADAGGYSDDTGPRIRAFLSSMGSLRGIGDYGSAEYRNAINAISQLACSSQGTEEPTYQLTREQAADILLFMRLSEPVHSAKWWTDPDDAPSHVCGYAFVLEAVEKTLRVRRPQR